MACLRLDDAQASTLHEMGFYHPHPCARQRAQALQQLAPVETLATVATRFGVHLNRVESWAHWRRQRGIVGLFKRVRPGRPPKWNATRQHTLAELAQQRSGSAQRLLETMAFGQAQAILARLTALDRQALCCFLFFDGSGFIPNPPITYGWSRPLSNGRRDKKM